jgi:broad specificity phosphatase PhoE
VALIYLVQHAEKVRTPGDPGLTARGRHQARQVADHLARLPLGALYASPLRRAQETAAAIAAATGLSVCTDRRLTERMNWEPGQPIEDFVTGWERTTEDRDFVPAVGDSSRRTGERMRAFLDDHASAADPIAAVTHGGATIDLLRTLLGDEAVPPRRLAEGMPSAGLTVVDGRHVLRIGATDHLEKPDQ